MKKIPITATVERISPIANPDGSPIYRNGRIRSHRIILLSSASFEKAIAEVAKVKRTDDKVAAFCLKRDDGKYAMDLTPQQVQLLTGGRMTVPQLQFVCKNAAFVGTVETREIGDVVFNRTTQEEQEIKEGHAQVQELSVNLPMAVEDKILHSMFSSVSAPAATAPVPAAAAVEATHALDIPDEQEEAAATVAPARSTATRVTKK